MPQLHPSSPPLPPLLRLREMTRAPHEALHGHPMLHALGEGTAGRSELRQAIAAFHGFHVACDQVLGNAGLPGFEASPHTIWLKADLHALGYPPSSITALAVCGDIPIVSSRGERFGHLYVREGATLGGQTIARHLAATCGTGPESGYRYFSGHGPKKTGGRWKNFIRQLDSLSAEEAEEAAFYAARLFSRLEAWLWTCYRKQ